MLVRFDRKPGQIAVNPDNILYAFEHIDQNDRVSVIGVGVMFKGNPNALSIMGITLEEFEAKIKG